MTLVRRRGAVAVRATRLLLDRRGRCWRILRAFKNSIEVLLRRRYSSHLCDLPVGRPTHGFPAVRQHQLQDPRWRRGAVVHALPQIGRRLDADRVVGWESARRGEDVLRQDRTLPDGSRRWCRHCGGGDVWSCTKRSSIICSVRLLLVGLGRSALVGGCEGRKGVPRRCRSRFLGHGRCLAGLPAALLGASSWAWHFFLFSDGGLWFVDPTVVTTMEPGLSRILVSKCGGRSRRSCARLVAGVGAERASQSLSRSGEGVAALRSLDDRLHSGRTLKPFFLRCSKEMLKLE